MDRRKFLQLSGAGLGVSMLPLSGNLVAESKLTQSGIDLSVKKEFADVALNTATKLGATYADVRIGRYLNQYVVTREMKVQDVVNTESIGMGIRVIANGTWGFAATNDLTADGVARATRQAVATAKANSSTSRSQYNWPR